MRINAPALSLAGIRDVLGAVPGTSVTVTIKPHADNSRKQYFVTIQGTGRMILGKRGPTYDERGTYLARLFQAAPNATVSVAELAQYRSAKDFLHQTAGRFANPESLPHDTHRYHRWDVTSMGHLQCFKCSALKRAPSDSYF